MLFSGIKTIIAEALALESGFNLVKMRNIQDKWVGSSERNLELVLKRFGFSEIHQQEFGKSIEPKLVLYRSIRASESLYVDARK